MAELIPLNNFRLLLKPLESGSNVLYQETTNNVDTIILSLHLANKTETIKRVTVKLQNDDFTTTLIKNAPVPPEDAINPFAGRVVLEFGNSLIVETDTSGSIDSSLSILENANE